MIKGCTVPNSEMLNEGYKIYEERIEANVNADKILNLFFDFIDAHLDYFFLILEIPTNIMDEPKTPEGEVSVNHKDVYYKDGMTAIEAKALLTKYAGLFINDGLAQIGIGAHTSVSEIVTDKYNRVYALGRNTELLEAIFKKNDIPKVDELVTAWNYFSKENPGSSFGITENGQTIYDALEMLKKETDIYFAERRED